MFPKPSLIEGTREMRHSLIALLLLLWPNLARAIEPDKAIETEIGLRIASRKLPFGLRKSINRIYCFNGLFIENVKEDSLAGKLDLKTGQFILNQNREQFVESYEQAKAEGTFRMEVASRGHLKTYSISFPKPRRITAELLPFQK